MIRISIFVQKNHCESGEKACFSRIPTNSRIFHSYARAPAKRAAWQSYPPPELPWGGRGCTANLLGGGGGVEVRNLGVEKRNLGVEKRNLGVEKRNLGVEKRNLAWRNAFWAWRWNGLRGEFTYLKRTFRNQMSNVRPNRWGGGFETPSPDE
jgi:hypothetical protein